MSAPDLNEDFQDALSALTDAGVEFLVVGAHALAAHGLPRATGDLDIWVRPSPDNAVRVERALKAFGAPIAAHGITARDFETPGTVYQIGLPPRRIDVLTEISGVAFDEAWATKTSVTVGGRSFYVLGREALLTNKRAAGRPKDLLDVAALEGKAVGPPRR
jgi:hypothetical protein